MGWFLDNVLTPLWVFLVAVAHTAVELVATTASAVWSPGYLAVAAAGGLLGLGLARWGR